jgi:hypothetical protein
MADLFEITAAMPSQQLDSSGHLVDVMIVTGQTFPHNVSFTVTVPKTAGWHDAAIAAARTEAQQLEAIYGTYGG